MWRCPNTGCVAVSFGLCVGLCFWCVCCLLFCHIVVVSVQSHYCLRTMKARRARKRAASLSGQGPLSSAPNTSKSANPNTPLFFQDDDDDAVPIVQQIAQGSSSDSKPPISPLSVCLKALLLCLLGSRVRVWPKTCID